MTSYPPFYPLGATGSEDWSSRSGAEKLAAMIREAWARVGVIAKVEVFVASSRHHQAVGYATRLDMPGGLPDRESTARLSCGSALHHGTRYKGLSDA